MHHVTVAGALAAETGVAEDERLLSAFHHPPSAGERCCFVGLLELVEDHRTDDAGETVADRLVGAEAGPGLAYEHDADAAGSRPLHQVDSSTRPI